MGGNLWKHRDFKRLWLSDTVSLFGNQFTNLALPLLAILTFHVDPFELGLLPTLAFLPYPTLGLFVGVWTDRFRKHKIMIACNLGRMLALGSIPLSFFFGTLSLIQLYLVALANGILSVWFDVAYQSYLPVLVAREDLVEGNQKLQISASGAQVAGPGVAGIVYQFVGWAVTIAADAFGYLVSFLSLLSIKKQEQKNAPSEGVKPNFFREMKEGINIVFDNPVLKRIAGSTATSNFGSNIWGAVFLLFALPLLNNSSAAVGLVGSIGAVGFVLGVLLSRKFTAKLGVGITLAVATGSGFIALVNPLAQYGYPFFVLSVVAFIGGVFLPMYNINAVSLRQAITPDRLQGRMNATTRTIVWGTLPLGSFVGGILGGAIGVVNTIYLGAFVSGLAVLWILIGPVRKIKTQPTSPEEGAVGIKSGEGKQ